MGIAAEKMSREFIREMDCLKVLCIENAVGKLKEKGEKAASCASVHMEKSLDKLCKTYNTLRSGGETGELSYIYISFLRTAILQKTAWYRMDAYDSRDRASTAECGFALDFLDFSDILRSCAEPIVKSFDKQSRVKEYELDKILYKIADQLRMETDYYISDILCRVLRKSGRELFEIGIVNIMLGEYLDQARWITGWNQGEPMSYEAYVCLRGKKDCV